VTVFVKEYNSSRVTVEGAVKKPGVHPLRGNETLLRAIALAEGVDRETASTNVVVFSSSGGARTATRYDIGEIRGGRMADPAIQAGDVVVVEDSALKSGFKVFTQLLPLGSPLSLLFLAL
jgi:polysaccharide export outer membrane protein